MPADGHNLVRPRTTFVGRDRELSELTDAIGSGPPRHNRGPGGIGKTRLVIEWGLGHADEWPDGVWMVEFAAVVDRAAVPSTSPRRSVCRCRATAIRGTRCSAWLADRRAVVVFDNCEHVIDEVAACVDALLDHCPHVAVVATSREPLGVAGEEVCRLGALDATHAGLELFIERARGAARGDFEASEQDVEAIRELCVRLDGLPLAIELAAARVSVMSPAQILAGLDGRFQHLQHRQRGVPERQRTMQALLDWSWDLLTADERCALARLSLFVASFDHEAAAAAVAWGDLEGADVTGLLLSLLDKSLIVVDATNGHRSKLLETVRAYARRRLDELDEAARRRSRARHAVTSPDSACMTRAPDHLIGCPRSRSRWRTSQACIEALSPADVSTAQELACIIVRRSRTLDPQRALGHADSATSIGCPARTPLRVAQLGRGRERGHRSSRRGPCRANARRSRGAARHRSANQLWAENRLEQQRGLLAVFTGDPGRGRRDRRARAQRSDHAPRSCARTQPPQPRLPRSGDVRRSPRRGRRGARHLIGAGDLGSAVVAAGNAAEAAMRAGDNALAAARQQLALDWSLQLGQTQAAAFAVVLAARLAADDDDWRTARDGSRRAPTRSSTSSASSSTPAIGRFLTRFSPRPTADSVTATSSRNQTRAL